MKVIILDAPGLSHYTSYLASGLSKYHDIIYCGFSKHQFEVTKAATKNIEYLEMGQYVKSSKGLLKLVSYPLSVFVKLFKLLLFTEYDILHFNGHLPMLFLYLPLVRFRKKRIFWTVHDITLRPSTSGFRGKAEVYYVRALSQPTLMFKSANSIFVHGQMLKNELNRKGYDSGRVHVIPHLDYDYLLQSKTSNMKGDHIEGEYILFFGQIKPYKGLELLIKSSRILRQEFGNNFKILIAGNGQQSYLESILKEEDVENIATRLEHIPTDEIAPIFSKAMFVVLPYTSGSQSGVLSLAYTFSKPVIASNVGALSEYIDHGLTGFIFDSGDEVQLANHLLYLLEDPVKCKEMGRQARLKLEREMSLKKTSEYINELYVRN